MMMTNIFHVILFCLPMLISASNHNKNNSKWLIWIDGKTATFEDDFGGWNVVDGGWKRTLIKDLHKKRSRFPDKGDPDNKVSVFRIINHQSVVQRRFSTF